MKKRYIVLIIVGILLLILYFYIGIQIIRAAEKPEKIYNPINTYVAQGNRN
jgi:C4-dicarboxylate transporter